MSRSKGKRRVVALALVAGLAVSACNGDDDAESASTTSETTESTTSTSESTTTTDPEAELKAEVEAAYMASWDAFEQIYANPDPANPLIKQTYTGVSLEAVLDEVSRSVLEGEAIRRPDDPANLVIEVMRIEPASEEEAVVTACWVDGYVVYDQTSGAVKNETVSTKTTTAVMRLEDGRWKIAEVTNDRVEGNPGCD